MNDLERRIARLEADTAARRLHTIICRPGEDVDDVLTRAGIAERPGETVIVLRSYIERGSIVGA